MFVLFGPRHAIWPTPATKIVLDRNTRSLLLHSPSHLWSPFGIPRCCREAQGPPAVFFPCDSPAENFSYQCLLPSVSLFHQKLNTELTNFNISVYVIKMTWTHIFYQQNFKWHQWLEYNDNTGAVTGGIFRWREKREDQNDMNRQRPNN